MKLSYIALGFAIICQQGCASGNTAGVAASPAKAEVSVRRPQEKPQTTLSNSCLNSRRCYFSVQGFWRSATGKAGSELANPTFVKIWCETTAKTCTETDASVDSIGRLDSDTTEYPVTSWSGSEIIATTNRGLCDIGSQLVIDLANEAVVLRDYPTKPADQICQPFSETNSYVLRGGTWQLHPAADKSFD
jgi:hypothetical protein